MKMKKLALATAVATLTASLSVFSSVTASATTFVVDSIEEFFSDQVDGVDNSCVPLEDIVTELDFVVLSVNVPNRSAYVVEKNYLPARHQLCDDLENIFSYDIWKMAEAYAPFFGSLFDQIKPGDIIHYHGENVDGLSFGCHNLYHSDAPECQNDTIEIVGSIFDTPLERFEPITIGEKSAIVITLDDGTKFVAEEDFGINGKRAWVLPNEDGESNSGTQTPPSSTEDNISEPEGTWSSEQMVVVDVKDDFVVVAWDGEAPANDKRGMIYNFYKLDKSSPEMADISNNIKYGDIIYYRGTGEMVFAGNPLIDDMSFVSGEGKIQIFGSVVDGPHGDFMSVTNDAGETLVMMNKEDSDKCYLIESGSDYNTITDFLTWICDENHTEDLTNKYNWKKSGAFWIRPNVDGDVNSDDTVDSADAAVILEEIALNSVGDTGKMNMSENQVADVNSDGTINAQDAAVLLSYSAEVGSGMLEGVTLKAYAGQ